MILTLTILKDVLIIMINAKIREDLWVHTNQRCVIMQQKEKNALMVIHARKLIIE